jgi:hypothetical protein
MKVGTRIQCSGSCGAVHTGTVSAVIVPGVGVAVSWDGFVAAPGKGTPEARFMRELKKAHSLVMVHPNTLQEA